MKAWKILTFLVVLGILTVVNAEVQKNQTGDSIGIYRELAAALAISLSAVGAGYAIGATGSASVGAVVEKPELFGKVLVFVAFAEAIAIYGLLVSLTILFKIGG